MDTRIYFPLSYLMRNTDFYYYNLEIYFYLKANIIKTVTQELTPEEYTDDNMYNIGMSSGKFFKHMSIGQPVIVNDVSVLAGKPESIQKILRFSNSSCSKEIREEGYGNI